MRRVLYLHLTRAKVSYSFQPTILMEEIKILDIFIHFKV